MYSKTKTQIIEIVNKLNGNNFNFSDTFISPAWYTIIKTHFEKNNLIINDLVFSDNVKSFLNNLWFFNKNDYCISNLKRSKILPLKTINSQDWSEIEEIWNEFYKLLSEFLPENTKFIANISSIIWELLNNISHHSWKKDVYDDTWDVIISTNYQSWQCYNNKSFVQISIVDSWIWILSSVRKKKPEISKASDAIMKALELRFTWWTTLDPKNKNFSWITNRWIWLTATFDILKKLKWDLFIWTKDCLFSYNWKQDKEYYDKIINWSWTFIVFNIYLDWNSDIDFSKIKQDLLWEGWNIKDIEINIDFW